MYALQGFIMLHRKILDWEWYADANVRSVFIHLLLLASFKQSKWQGQDIAPGQVITSYARIAEKLGLGVWQVRVALRKLQTTGEISVKATNRNTVVTIENWALYQADTEKATSKPHASHTQTTSKPQHRNNVNNFNNVDKYSARAQSKKPGIFHTGRYDYDLIMQQSRERIRQKIAGKEKETA